MSFGEYFYGGETLRNIEVRGNTCQNNAYGIFAADGVDDSLFTDNTATGNSALDLLQGDGATGNTWTNNTHVSSVPAVESIGCAGPA